MAHEKISSEDCRFIKKVIGPQLRNNASKVQITLNGQTWNIDYCTISNGQPKPSKGTIVLLTGFGSGWRGIAMLGMYLTKLGFTVCMVSLPGCGNSDNPFPPYYMTEGFGWESLALAKFVEKVLPNTKIHPVGHSMGAKIVTDLASNRPDLVETLTLLAPAGFEKQNRWSLLVKFAVGGIAHKLAFGKNAVWTELEKFLPAEESAFTKERRPQRKSEWRRLCIEDDAKSIIRRLPARISMHCVWGKMDNVYPIEKSCLASMAMRNRYHEKTQLPLYHNMTMFGSHRTAAAIDAFIWQHNELK